MSRRTTAIAAALSVLALGFPLIIAKANPLGNSFFYSGVEKYEQGDYQGAIADWGKAIEINPQLALAYNNRGTAKYQKRDLKGACADWEEASSLGDKDATWLVKDKCL